MELQRHSSLGIASFITSIASGFLIFFAFVIAGVMSMSSPEVMDEESASAIILGLCLFGSLLVSLVALGLGISGLLQKDRRQIFAVLGTVFSVVMIAGTFLLVLLGLAME